MPQYFYIAKSISGETKTGRARTKNKHELAQDLREKGYFLISAELEQETKKNFLKKLKDISLFGKGVKLKEKIFFTRNLGVMIGAGVSLPRALETLAEQTKNKTFREAILGIKDDIVKGNSFSESLSLYPNIFSELFKNMVRAGEESGTLEEVLKVLTEQMEREHQLRSNVLGAMLYPAVIITAMTGIGILMLIMVVPKLAETFEELEVELPMTTRFIVFLGKFLSHRWYIVLLAAIVLAVLIKIFLTSEKGKMFLNKAFLKLPFVSTIVKKVNSAYTARTLSSLISAGVPIVRSLEITSGVVGNIYFKRALLKASKKVKKGERLFESLSPYKNLFPLVVLQMIEVGEETGQTSEILKKLALFYEEEVARTTKNLSSVIEPVLMLLIGGAVGFFAISMFQPMYSMLQYIK